MKRFNNISGKNAVITVLVLMACATACSGTKDGKQSVAVAGNDAADVEVLALELPRIPSTISEPEDMAGFLAIHFWDNLDFKDSEKSLDADFMERNFVEYLSILPAVLAEDRKAAFNELIERASVTPETRDMIVMFGKKYLHHPQSPMHNDEYYRDFVAASQR